MSLTKLRGKLLYKRLAQPRHVMVVSEWRGGVHIDRATSCIPCHQECTDKLAETSSQTVSRRLTHRKGKCYNLCKTISLQAAALWSYPLLRQQLLCWERNRDTSISRWCSRVPESLREATKITNRNHAGLWTDPPHGGPMIFTQEKSSQNDHSDKTPVTGTPRSKCHLNMQENLRTRSYGQ